MINQSEAKKNLEKLKLEIDLLEEKLNKNIADGKLNTDENSNLFNEYLDKEFQYSLARRELLLDSKPQKSKIVILLERIKNNSCTSEELKDFFNGQKMIVMDDEQSIYEALAENTSITKVDLRDKICLSRELFEALKWNKGITELNISNNNIFDQGELFGKMMIFNRTLKNVCLEKTAFGFNGLRELGEALKKNKSLTTLCLGYNEIDDTGFKFIIEALKVNKTLVNLCLNGNRLTNKTAIALADIAKNHRFLRKVDLFDNKVEPKVGIELDKMLAKNAPGYEHRMSIFLGFHQRAGAKSSVLSFRNHPNYSKDPVNLIFAFAGISLKPYIKVVKKTEVSNTSGLGDFEKFVQQQSKELDKIQLSSSKKTSQ